jgi:anti-sigma regulatory factor (Ser/Thr protein kinase)
LVDLDMRLPGGTVAPRLARSIVNELSGRVPPEVLEDLRLLVTEVVTNSVRHARTGPESAIRLKVSSRPKAVRLEVTDQGPGFDPVPRGWDESRESGWGLYLVDRLSDRWGVAFDSGTRVWLEVEHPAIAA